MSKEEGHILLGMLLCWLLNIVQLGIAAVLLTTGERTLPTVFILVGAIGLLQFVYVIPIWRLFRNRGKSMTARGLLIAASITALLNAACWGGAVGRLHF